MEDRFFTLQMLERRMRELENFRMVESTELSFNAMEDTLGPDTVHSAAPESVSGKTLRVGDDFKGRDGYLWARAQVDVPPAKPGLTPMGRFDFGKTGGGHNSGFESLLYIDREPYQGVDTNHAEVMLTPFAGKRAEFTFLLWTGLEGGGEHRVQEHRVRCAQIGYLHQETDDFYYAAKAIVKTLIRLPEEDPVRPALMHALEDAMNRLHWEKDRFYHTVGEAWACLKESLRQIPKASDITVSCVGHTHIDVAWLWRLKHTREKAIRSFSTALRMMDEFDEFIFLQSQPQLYKYIKQDAPALFEKIKRRVAEGRWEAEGGMWLEADCNVTSGESLVRQFLHGIRFVEKEFGRRCEYLWLPDVFGYSWALPQIMRKFGLRFFVTTKISWNQYNTMPDDLFTWRGMDGSEVTTYFITTPEVGHPLDSRFSTYNGMISPRSVLGSWKKFRNKDISRETLISYGFGDGGGGVNRNMLKMRRAMEELPGLPHVKPSRAGDFLKRLEESAGAHREEMHVWDGELYLEYHRGTYTTQANNKRMNRKLEFLLTETEWLSGLAWLKGAPYDRDSLHEAWETLLRNQFHDIIPGSSIREVYEDSALEYRKAYGLLAKAQSGAVNALVRPEEGAYTLYHSGSFARKDCVFLPEKAGGAFYTAEGKPLPAQRVKEGYYVLASSPALSMQTIRFEKRRAARVKCPFAADLDSRTLQTPYYDIAWDENGFLTSLYDRGHARQVLAGLGNALEIYEDKPLNYDAWDIDLFHTKKREYAQLCAPVEAADFGPLRATLRFTFAYNRSLVRQDMIVYADSRRIDFETYVDWQEEHRLLKTAFQVDIRATKATYDIQFGHVERPTHYNTSWDYARFEAVGHKWADLSEGGYGVSLLNDCKYGYAIHDRTIRLSLLKSSKSPDTRADMGAHTFTYSLLPHPGTVIAGDTIQEAVSLNLPVRVISGRALDTRRLLMTGSDSVIIDAVKQTEEGGCLVAHTHECRGTTVRAAVTSEHGPLALVPCSLLEEDEGAPIPPGMVVTWKPFEIKAFKLSFTQTE